MLSRSRTTREVTTELAAAFAKCMDDGTLGRILNCLVAVEDDEKITTYQATACGLLFDAIASVRPQAIDAAFLQQTERGVRCSAGCSAADEQTTGCRSTNSGC